MDEWIEGLIEYNNGDLAKAADGAYYVQISYKEGGEKIWLSSHFTAKQLQSLANHMNKYNKEEE